VQGKNKIRRMKMKKKTFRAAMVIINVCMLLMLSGPLLTPGFAAEKKAPKEIVLGQTWPLSGPFAWFGEECKRGVDIAVEIVNEAGGVYLKEYGKKLPVRLITYDDAGDGNKMSTLAIALITVDKVDGIVGGGYNNIVWPLIANIVSKHKIPASTLWGGDMFKRGNKWIFSSIVPYEDYAAGPAWALRKVVDDKAIPENDKPRKIAVIADNSAFSGTCLEGFKKILKDHGGFQFVFEERVPFGLTDYSPQILKLKRANADVILLINPWTPDVLVFFKQVKEYDLNAKMWINAFAHNLPFVLDPLGKIADYVLTQAIWFKSIEYEGVICGDIKWSNADWIARSKKKGKEPFDWDLASGSGVFMILDAMYQAGSLNKEAVRDKLARTDMLTPRQPIVIDPKTGLNTYSKSMAIQVQNGVPQVVYPDYIQYKGKNWKSKTADIIYPTPEWSKRP
jgi:branched-chain amino acid transport system substrate-binding protein